MSRKVQFGLAVLVISFALLATRLNEVDVPLARIMAGKNRVDAQQLHLKGEFVESNLGTAQERDGSITVRLIAEQFLFVPHCILVPVGVPVQLRITSADVVHKFSVSGLDYQAEATPGAVTEAALNFPRPGDYDVPCREFCGAGHYAMRSQVRAVPREQFRNLRPEERVTWHSAMPGVPRSGSLCVGSAVTRQAKRKLHPDSAHGVCTGDAGQ